MFRSPGLCSLKPHIFAALHFSRETLHDSSLTFFFSKHLDTDLRHHLEYRLTNGLEFGLMEPRMQHMFGDFIQGDVSQLEVMRCLKQISGDVVGAVVHRLPPAALLPLTRICIYCVILCAIACVGECVCAAALQFAPTRPRAALRRKTNGARR